MNVFNLSTSFTPIVLATTMLLGGCAIGPDYNEPQTAMADVYLNAVDHDTEISMTQTPYWWLQLNDETLNQLVHDAQKQNIPLKLASERIKMAQSYQDMVESFKVPTVNLGAGYFNYQISQNDPLLGTAVSPIGVPVGAQPMLGQSVTIADKQQSGGFLGATIAWEVDLFGRIDKQTNAAQIRKTQAEIYQSGLNTLITADVIHNYLQYRGAQERTQLALDNIADQRETLNLVEKMVSSGYGSELDLAQAEAMLAATESVIPQLDIAKQVHKHRLAILLGEPLTKVDIRLSGEGGLPKVEGIIPIGLPSDLLTRRPDIRIAEREMAAINQELGVSIANRYPKFFLTGSPGLVAGDFSDLFSSDSFSWVGSAGISWNVFDGGRGEAMVDINESRFKSAALRYQHTVDGAFAEVDSMLFTYGRSQENQRRIDEANRSTDNAVMKAKSLYRAGLINHLAVLDAQRQQKLMQDRQIAAKLQTAQVTVGLYKALGGDWDLTSRSGSGSGEASQ
ncbi:efflux transporter outer membrane subunit [Vibrio cortegadensis]|uniref:Efflux transporter outer membrane subunit n=1 Tax=Vibrio cortegadensis TaxID=1328770 RepID=A0ABV4M2R7_9VIBR